MPTLYVIIGLPGSGKSYYIKNELLAKSKVNDSCIFDDYHTNAKDDSPLTKNSRHFNALVNSLDKGNDCAVADIAFCQSGRLQEFIKTIQCSAKNVIINIIYFENIPEVCKKNIKNDMERTAEERCKKVDELKSDYIIPDGVTHLEVKEWK